MSRRWALLLVGLLVLLAALAVAPGGNDSVPCQRLEPGEEPSDVVDTEKHEITVVEHEGERAVCVMDRDASTDVFNESDGGRP